jgi:hypothetical protein
MIVQVAGILRIADALNRRTLAVSFYAASRRHNLKVHLKLRDAHLRSTTQTYEKRCWKRFWGEGRV